MNTGRIVRNILLSLVDATLPPLVVVGLVLAITLVPIDSRYRIALVAGAVTFPLAFLGSLAFRRRSSNSFPLTHAAVTVVRRFPLWV